MDGTKLRILLVEDDALNYMDFEEALENEGYEVLSHPDKPIVDNYDDAVEVALAGIPNLAVLDVDIKGDKDGIDVGLFIRENFGSPVIFLSNLNASNYIDRAGLIGADGYVLKQGKPINLEQLKTDIIRLKHLANSSGTLNREGRLLLLKETTTPVVEALGFRHTRIVWKDLLFINSNSGKNKDYIELVSSNNKRHLCHRSLKDFLTILPKQFVQFNGHQIININQFTHRGRSEWIYYIEENRYEISEAFRNVRTLALLPQLTF